MQNKYLEELNAVLSLELSTSVIINLNFQLDELQNYLEDVFL